MSSKRQRMTVKLQSTTLTKVIATHLCQSGFNQSARMLLNESGTGLSQYPALSTIQTLPKLCLNGQWGNLLKGLELMIGPSSSSSSSAQFTNTITIINEVKELCFLELCDAGEFDLARAFLNSLNETSDSWIDSEYAKSGDNDAYQIIGASRRDRMISAMQLQNSDNTNSSSNHNNVDYGTHNGNPLLASSSSSKKKSKLNSPDVFTRQLRRERMAEIIEEFIPTAPSNLFKNLVGEALMWKQVSGGLEEFEEDHAEDIFFPLQTVDATENHNQNQNQNHSTLTPTPTPNNNNNKNNDTCISKQWGVIKQKSTEITSSQFFPLITSSGEPSPVALSTSDGFLLIHSLKTCKLLTASPHTYQKDESFMVMDGTILSVAISFDGEMVATGSDKGCVMVWGTKTGSCLRKFESLGSTVLSLAFFNDGSKVLCGGGDGVGKELGLRSNTVIMEYRGHGSFINAVCYGELKVGGGVSVVTGSSDGSLKIYNRDSGECLKSIEISGLVGDGKAMDRPCIALFALKKKSDAIIVVPRGDTATLILNNGKVLISYTTSVGKGGQGGEFVAAAVSFKEKWLYCCTDSGLLYCFDLKTGSIEKCLEAADSTITGMCSHPHKGLLGTWSKNKKGGALKLWK